MTTLHLRKINGPQTAPRTVDWICSFHDDIGVCTSCSTIQGKPSVAFLGKHINFIDKWVSMGNIDGVAYHQVVAVID